MTQIYELNKLKEIIATNTNPRSVSMLYGNHTCKFFDDLKTARQEIFSIDPEKLKNVEMVSYGSKHFYRKLYTSETIFKDLLKNQLQKPLSLKLKKIYPLSVCEIRVLRVEKDESSQEKKVENPKPEEKKPDEKTEDKK